LLVFIDRNDSALDDLEQCLILSPKFAPAYSCRAAILYHRGDVSGALGNISKALSLRPDHNGDKHNRGVIFTALGKYRAAISDYLHVIEKDPQSGGTFNNLGWIYATARDPTIRDGLNAVKYAKKAVALGRTGAWLDTLAAAYAESGDFEQAVKTETEAYRISHPQNVRFKERIEFYRKKITYAHRFEERDVVEEDQ